MSELSGQEQAVRAKALAAYEERRAQDVALVRAECARRFGVEPSTMADDAAWIDIAGLRLWVDIYEGYERGDDNKAGPHRMVDFWDAPPNTQQCREVCDLADLGKLVADQERQRRIGEMLGHSACTKPNDGEW